MCRLEKNWEPRCRLWGLDWKSTLEVAVRWSSSPPPSPPPPPSSSSPPPSPPPPSSSPHPSSSYPFPPPLRLKEHVRSGCQVKIISKDKEMWRKWQSQTLNFCLSSTSSSTFSSLSCSSTSIFSSFFSSSSSSSAGWLQPSECEQQSWSRLDMPVKSRNEAMRIWKGTAKWKDRDISRQNGGERGGGISVTYLKFLWWAVYYL